MQPNIAPHGTQAYPYLATSTNIPVGQTHNPLTRLKKAVMLQKRQLVELVHYRHPTPQGKQVTESDI
jgi:hypothetical protein